LAIGEAVFFAMIGSRKWKAEYVNCCIVIQSMLYREVSTVSTDLVEPTARHPFPSTSIYASRALVLVQTGILGSAILAATVLANVDEVGWMAYLLLVPALGLLYMNYLICNRILRRAETFFWANPLRSWYLSGLGSNIQNDKKDGL
jgi:hypothetical protein